MSHATPPTQDPAAPRASDPTIGRLVAEHDLFREQFEKPVTVERFPGKQGRYSGLHQAGQVFSRTGAAAEFKQLGFHGRAPHAPSYGYFPLQGTIAGDAPSVQKSDGLRAGFFAGRLTKEYPERPRAA